MREYPRAHETRVSKLPDALSFEAAASVVSPGMTAYRALVDTARLEQGGSILIHSAAGSLGQIAVRISQKLGAHVFATVSSVEEKQFLVDTFSLPEGHIFQSQTTSFSQGVMHMTEGHGVDVLFNSLAGENSLRASCACMAPGGRFAEASLANIQANTALPMEMIANQLLKDTLQLLIHSNIHHSQPLQVLKVSETEQAFRQLQRDDTIGRVVVAPHSQDVVPQLIQERRPWTFDPDASYLIAGGSGGLGRAIIRWMVDRGARHLIVPSRSGATCKAAVEMVAELTTRRVNVFAPKCDVSNDTSLAAVLDDNGLQDAVFQDSMTFAQWELCLHSKVQTSQNLQRLLPSDLDFFILLSSLAGKALSLDIGWMRNIGIIAETGAYQRQRQASNDMQPVDDTELLALLSMCCDPSNPPPQARGQVLFGLRTPVDVLSHGQEPPALLDRPLVASFSYLINATSTNKRGTNHLDQAATLFRQSTDSEDRIQIVLHALAAKLSRAMSIPPEDVESSKPLSTYGVDSLMAVELRNWINKEFSAIVAVFDIMGGVSIASIADLVVARSEVGKSSA
ncbi:hypothetical protein QQZ08_005683 [Neonectria magnoliae]|uniref:Carrier domain-containing protein n=1 Tax=Neonectria magnoliae TaxID=2732573 RepID=A0ABR1I400_9HYPO